MTRSQRRWHTYLWFALGPLLVVGLLMALSARPPVPIQSETPSTADRVGSAAPAVKSPAAEGRP